MKFFSTPSKHGSPKPPPLISLPPPPRSSRPRPPASCSARSTPAASPSSSPPTAAGPPACRHRPGARPPAAAAARPPGRSRRARHLRLHSCLTRCRPAAAPHAPHPPILRLLRLPTSARAEGHAHLVATAACSQRPIQPPPRPRRAPGAASFRSRDGRVLPAPHPSAAPTGSCSRGPILPPPRPPILPAPPRLPLPPNLVETPAAAAANLLPALTPSGDDSSRHPIPQPLPPPFDARIVAASEPRRRRSTPWASRSSLATPLCSSPSRRAHPGRRCCHASSGRRTAPGGGARRPDRRDRRDRRAALVPKGWRRRRTTARCPGGRVGDRPLASCGPQPPRVRARLPTSRANEAVRQGYYPRITLSQQFLTKYRLCMSCSRRLAELWLMDGLISKDEFQLALSRQTKKDIMFADRVCALEPCSFSQ